MVMTLSLLLTRYGHLFDVLFVVLKAKMKRFGGFKMNLYSKTDVLIVGGGTAGVIAAIAAARNGARCLIIEQYGYFGGTMTASLIPHAQGFHAPGHNDSGRQIIAGIPQELFDRLQEAGGAIGHLKRPPKYFTTDTPYDAEIYKKVADEWIEEEGIKVLFHTFAGEPLMLGKEINGIIINNKSGRQLILSDVVIDCTGDGDIAAKAGAPYEKGRSEDGRCQAVSFQFQMSNIDFERFVDYLDSLKEKNGSVSERLKERVAGRKIGSSNESFVRLIGLMPKEAIEKEELPPDLRTFTVESIHEGEAILGHPHILDVDGTNADSLTQAEIDGRKKVHILVDALKKYIPGFEEAFLIQTPPQIGVRETRRILGDYILTQNDTRQGKKFEDTIALGAFPFDVHPVGELNDTWHEQEVPPEYGIPYRCLLPQDLENILVAGRCISTDHMAQGSVRISPIVMALGQAAGTAAALSVKNHCYPRKLNVEQLQKTLVSQGAILE